MPGVWTIVVAAGTGSRFGGAKQYAELGARRVLDHAIEVAASRSDGVVVVTPPDRAGSGATGATDAADLEGVHAVVAGGETRSASVRAGLAAVPEDAEVVVVHDAARPLAGADLFDATVAAVRAGADGAIPAVPVTDSLRHKRSGPIDRDDLVAVQTPQAFAAATLRAAHAAAPEATDDAAVVEAAGGRIELVPGDRWNLKITEPDDLVVAAALLAARASSLRVGNGFDVHAFVDADDSGRILVLGGVEFPDERPLAGHSDADVIAHACAEALLGAAGLGDLGSHFPDTDERWAGADSLALLAEVVRLAAVDGWRVVNVDCSVVAERPKLAPARDAMQAKLSTVVGGPVTVKGRRAESLGALGRGEGVACWATALIERMED